jgi:hypothetical protein
MFACLPSTNLDLWSASLDPSLSRVVWSVCFLSVEAHRAVLFFAPFLHLLLQERYGFHSVLVACSAAEKLQQTRYRYILRKQKKYST